jgi:L-alanine-DL-glutamate epimerase-like enolase superfamily enzyme
MDGSRIVSVAWGVLDGTRPRSAGSNARLGPHGEQVRVPLLRITTEDGTVGFGGCRATLEQACCLLGMHSSALFDPDRGVAATWRAFDYPLWDLAGKQAGRAVYALATRCTGATATPPFSAPCYDTSLYFDDLHLPNDQDAARLLAEEARAGYARGHRAFKIKVGRGARHMPLHDGIRRDIAVVHAVRAAVGREAVLMLDANNGYNLNLAKEVLQATSDCAIYWLEEAFHEDDILYGDLRAWLRERNMATLVADGEGQADPRLLAWAQAGLVDVVQYDIVDHGFTNWRALGQQLDGWNVRSAPHHYGGHYGNYVAGHLAGAIEWFSFVEWDEATVPGLDTSQYQVIGGRVMLPDVPGFGIALDHERFEHVVAQGRFSWTFKTER